MKKSYLNPETEIVTIGLSNVILDEEDPEMSPGELGPTGNLTNESDIFEEDDMMKGSSGNLWDK